MMMMMIMIMKEEEKEVEEEEEEEEEEKKKFASIFCKSPCIFTILITLYSFLSPVSWFWKLYSEAYYFKLLYMHVK